MTALTQFGKTYFVIMPFSKKKVGNRKKQLRAAEELRKGQSLAEPAIDVPWCYYDLAEMKLYQRDRDGFLSYLAEGVSCSEDWQIETFHGALKETLVDTRIDLPGLKEGMKKLQQTLSQIRKQK